VLAGLAAFTAIRGGAATYEAFKARAAFERAEQQVGARQLDPARDELLAARGSLERMRRHLDGLGPVLPVLRGVPLVRSQVRAVETYESVGTTLVDAGLRLTDATQRVLHATQGAAPLSGALESLQGITASLAEGAASVRHASSEVKRLDDLPLVWPVARTRDDLLQRLPRYERQATSAAEGVDAMIRFLGGHGSRRYLFLSQNPDEIRPTGGFIGTYGLLTAAPGEVRLDQFEPVGNFRQRHPEAALPGPTPAALQFTSDPYVFPHALANVNTTADFSEAGRRAAALWNAAGEPPVDGVVSFTPLFLVRILGVLGPVVVPGYGETVDQDNLIERFDFYTRQLETDVYLDVERKGFLSALGDVVMQHLLAAPSAKWQALADAVGHSFAAREAMAWSSDPVVQSALAKRGWDGVLPATSGDFFYNAEVSYPAKVSRDVRRTFDHHVQLRADGSARVTTTMTVNNTRSFSPLLNPGAKSYVTLYGPAGAVLDPASDRPHVLEPSLSGHPGAGWLVEAPPLGTATVKVVWEVENLVPKVDRGRRYSLTWLPVPDHHGDVLNLRVDLPKGWRWKGASPPARFALDKKVDATWEFAPLGQF
jgi:hypothetical protein